MIDTKRELCQLEVLICVHMIVQDSFWEFEELKEVIDSTLNFLLLLWLFSIEETNV